MSSSEAEDITDRKIGVLIEHFDDQFQRVIEAVESKTDSLPRIKDKLEILESEVKLHGMTLNAIKHNTKMLKLRSDKESDEKEKILERLEDLSNRVAKLERI